MPTWTSHEKMPTWTSHRIVPTWTSHRLISWIAYFNMFSHHYFEKRIIGTLSTTLSTKYIIFILHYRKNEEIPTSTVCNTTGWGWTDPIFQERPSVLHLAQIPIHNRHVHVLLSKFHPIFIQILTKFILTLSKIYLKFLQIK